MVRVLYVLSISAVLAACGVLSICIRLWVDEDVPHSTFLRMPTAVQRFNETVGERQRAGMSDVSPLMAQAEILASYLSPPEVADRGSPKTLSMPEIKQETIEPAPAIRPVTPSVRFRLCATSYYPNEPSRSMALIFDVGSPEGDQWWVKEGAKLGHFVVHEIRRGMIVYRDGGQLREMAVERGAELPRLVRDPRPGSPTARAATPADPDNIQIGGD